MTPLAERVFCCRSLRFDHVELVGFDMDYTLAEYRRRAMDDLVARATLRRLVEAGYPERLAALTCPLEFPIRGLMVDVSRGNVLKMDRYRYVKVAYHGLRQLSREERRQLYDQRRLRRSERYRWVDTQYSLPDVAVYVAVVEALEHGGDEVHYEQLWDDVRRCADDAHGSGEVYEEILGDVPRYVRLDERLPGMLETLRTAGKRLFLLTNSPPHAADAVMSALLGGEGDWRRAFDVVVADAAKPSFFKGDRPFRDVAEPGRPVERLEQGRLYAGGNLASFERLVGVAGDAVLYVGDHIYGDVLRANVHSGWRTCMIVHELEDELVAEDERAADHERIDSLDAELDDLHDAMRAQRAGLGDADCAELETRVQCLEAERDELEAKVSRAHHPYWGSLFRAGTELSLFGSQLSQYAWLYTARAGNLAGYSPLHFFRAPRARLPHQ